MKRADTTLMKEINMNTVRRTLKRMETATKPQLAAETGLSVVTVAALVRELTERGELNEEETGTSTGGRPATVYRFDYAYRLALSLHLHEREGVDTVFASVVDLRGDIRKHEERLFDVLDRDSFLRWIKNLMQDYPRIQTIGLGIPGQAVEGRIEVSSHDRLRGTYPAKWIEEHFGVPVLLENDVNAALHGYLLEGAGDEEAEDGAVIGLYFPIKYPPGMAISWNGTLIGGKRGMAGEVKYLPLDIDWSRPPAGDAWNEIVCRIVHTASVVLAPERVVLYGARTDTPSWTACWNAYVRRHPLPAEPDIQWSERFAEHFASGLQDLALKTLEPKVR
ncbi:ROK family transcriptional regulator [Saccharibacillus endophyticus]|uniref:ROK family protein n=1 Tax=Saccharibacillus endophyticus TaxID=2060666 RepID=A0ABQ1ZMV3_9BACL|nr:ROK family protein [Saccharibacillus endophyticus]GGH69206.1 hypothetical protein GCM10007362_04020 [Saccharibacillus endophyticus]